jgi:peptidyl-prolyl cis-trans isomerase C
MKIHRCLYAILIIVTILAAGSTYLAAQETPADKVAVVNGIAINRSSLDREVSLYKERSASQGQPLSAEQMGKAKSAILDRLVEGELLYQESKKQGIRVEAKEIDDRINELRKRFPNDAEYKSAISKMGISEAEIRAQMERGLAINQLIKIQVTDKIVVSDEESKAFYDSRPELFKQPEQVKASHILIKAAQDADEAQKKEARKKIEAVQKKLKGGQDFAALAREFSEGPSAPRGGELGYFGRGQMVPAFETVAFAMKPGEVSDIVETRFGYHLIKVEDKKSAGTVSYTEVKGQLDDHLKKQKGQQEIDKFVNGLKKNAKIEISS